MADKREVRKQLEAIEADRKIGRLTVPPARLARGNLLGGKTEAFIEAVRQQGLPKPKAVPPLALRDMMTPKAIEPYTQSGEVWAEAERIAALRRRR